MSIRIMSLIWEHSPQEGSALLMLLAIADHANDEGTCFPSKRTLAKKCRMSERQAGRLINKLVDDGELEITRGGGRGRSNVYKVTPVTGFKDETPPSYRVTSTTPFKKKTLTSATETETPSAERVTPTTVNPDIAMSYQSSEPLKKPSEESLKSQTLWIQALTKINTVEYTQFMRNEVFSKFWEPTEVVSEEDDRIVVACLNPDDPDYQRQWLEERGTERIERILTGITGRRIKVEFEVNEPQVEEA